MRVGLSIRLKTVLIVAAIFFCVISAIIAVSNYIFTKEYSEVLQRNAFVIGQNLKFQLEQLTGLGIPIEDLVGFEEQCQEVTTRHKDVAYAMVVDTRGKILFHSDSSKNGTVLKDLEIVKAIRNAWETWWTFETDNNKYYVAITPAFDSYNRQAGAIIIGLPADVITQKTKNLIVYSVGAAFILFVLGASLVFFAFSLWLNKPLMKLINVIKEIREKGLLNRKVSIYSKDEIGQLAYFFDGMLEDLRKTTTSVDNLNREIIERKKAEEHQTHLLEQLEKTNQELKDLVYIMSHDLKTPLRGINTLVSWISTDYEDKFDNRGKERIGLLLNRVKRTYSLIDGILQYSGIERVKKEKTQINLNKLVPNIIDRIAPPENITITIENELPVLVGDKTRLSQIFQNLLSNAVNCIDKPQGQIRIGCVEENGFWKFSVSDNGPGIDEKYFEKIFQIFQTLARRDETESTGIGLSIVKKIIGLYGGKIWVESQAGKGSTFFFTLPKQSDEYIKTFEPQEHAAV